MVKDDTPILQEFMLFKLHMSLTDHDIKRIGTMMDERMDVRFAMQDKKWEEKIETQFAKRFAEQDKKWDEKLDKRFAEQDKKWDKKLDVRFAQQSKDWGEKQDKRFAKQDKSWDKKLAKRFSDQTRELLKVIVTKQDFEEILDELLDEFRDEFRTRLTHVQDSISGFRRELDMVVLPGGRLQKEKEEG